MRPKIIAQWDWRAALVGLGFTVAAIVGAAFLKDPAGRSACVGILVAVATAVPSWLLHRTGADDTGQNL